MVQQEQSYMILFWMVQDRTTSLNWLNLIKNILNDENNQDMQGEHVYNMVCKRKLEEALIPWRSKLWIPNDVIFM